MHILVADDNAINNLYLKTLLEHEGHIVISVYNGKSAVESVQQNSADLIFMDISMPVMDGITATQILRERGYTGKIVAITAHVYSEDIKKYNDAGITEIVAKPFTKDSVLDALSTG